MFFSEHFHLPFNQWELDFVDIPLGEADVPLFIDPFAISRRNDVFSVVCHNRIVEFFQQVLDLITAEVVDGRGAINMLSGLREPNQTRFGLSTGEDPRGRGIGGGQAEDLYRALVDSNAARTGFITDLEDCELLIPNISRDKISDITTNIIRRDLITYTQDQCRSLGIPLIEIDPGFIWDSETGFWLSEYHMLPVYEDLGILLAPKAFARKSLEFSAGEYYSKYVVPYLQMEYFEAGSSLVRTLKDGTKKLPYKKDIKDENPMSKQFLYEFSRENPDVLNDYREDKAQGVAETSNETVVEATGHTQLYDFEASVRRLAGIQTGRDDASAYHDHIFGILEAVFYPHFIYPVKEERINNNRKRIDITFVNAAKDGFFYSLTTTKRIHAPYVLIECKNLSRDLGNPELDQLIGRASPFRGSFGIMICRSVDNMVLLQARCHDALTNHNFAILVLDDSDIELLLRSKNNGDEEAINRLLEEKYRQLVM